MHYVSGFSVIRELCICARKVHRMVIEGGREDKGADYLGSRLYLVVDLFTETRSYTAAHAGLRLAANPPTSASPELRLCVSPYT